MASWQFNVATHSQSRVLSLDKLRKTYHSRNILALSFWSQHRNYFLDSRKMEHCCKNWELIFFLWVRNLSGKDGSKSIGRKPFGRTVLGDPSTCHWLTKIKPVIAILQALGLTLPTLGIGANNAFARVLMLLTNWFSTKWLSAKWRGTENRSWVQQIRKTLKLVPLRSIHQLLFLVAKKIVAS